MDPRQALQQLLKRAGALVQARPELLRVPEVKQVLQRATDLLRRSEAQETAPDESLFNQARILWQLAKGDMQAFVQYLVTYPDPQLQQLARRPDMLRSIMMRLRQEPLVAAGKTPEGLDATPMQSSNVEGFKYDRNNKKLLVKFHEGGIYRYDGVPEQIAKAFMTGSARAKTKGRNRYGAWWIGKTPSIGASLAEHIKRAGYAYQRLA